MLEQCVQCPALGSDLEIVFDATHLYGVRKRPAPSTLTDILIAVRPAL